jgi:hypothetical protein
MGSTYTYRVYAVNSVGTSSPSVVSATPQDTTLQLSPLGKFTIDEKKTLSFTVKTTDSSLSNVAFSLEKSPPAGAKINSKTGLFTWTPTDSHGTKSYVFDIVAKKDSMIDRQSITITVNDVKISEPIKEPEPTTTTPPKELGIASFVDETKDPQSYVDRYNNEANYKEWFDENYAEYDSIYQAVGLEEQEFGECGEGTDLVDGMCIIVDNAEGGGCLIATATYGSEMAPQVQLLREIRDNQLMGSSSGSSFMAGFNQLYYLFSPTIADMERENPAFKEAVKIGITPLLSSLSIMSHAESESEVLGYGIGVLLLNIGMYVAAPAMLIYKARKYIRI